MHRVPQAKLGRENSVGQRMVFLMNTNCSSPVTRSRFRFNLRTLLISTAILGAVLGFVGNEIGRLRQHRQAERTVGSLGGMYGSYCEDQREARGPWWLPVVSDGLYADEEVVYFCSKGNEGLRDEDLLVLLAFPRHRLLKSAPQGSRMRDSSIFRLREASAGLCCKKLR